MPDGYHAGLTRSPVGIDLWVEGVPACMRDEDEIREQYEFLTEQLADEEMNHEGVRKMFTFYKRALGWVLEEEHM
jgi:hypothetical protein